MAANIVQAREYMRQFQDATRSPGTSAAAAMDIVLQAKSYSLDLHHKVLESAASVQDAVVIACSRTWCHDNREDPDNSEEWKPWWIQLCRKLSSCMTGSSVQDAAAPLPDCMIQEATYFA